MTTYLRSPHERPEDEGTAALVWLALAALPCALFWAVVLWGCRWLLQQPPVFWGRVGMLGLLLLGTALVFYALLQIERVSEGRRPGESATIRGAEANDVPPPLAGERRLLARGMGRTIRGVR